MHPLRLEIQDLETKKASPQHQRCPFGAVGRKLRKPRADFTNLLPGSIDFSSDFVPMQSSQVGGLQGVHVFSEAHGRKAGAGGADVICIGGGAVLLQSGFATSMPFPYIRSDSEFTTRLDMFRDVA